ncbi:hypothetical protein E3P92_03489 [Wallemia ichthyophaga]|uniref:Mannose-P-dolichol utilization defect 1 protein homolog n=1 Tax=Wallemia ichthyophaga TaxID=245174 RepID=A0A4T0KIH6_WALIC|nr:hypothetical protein E3P91_03519 [Wallemia ichthyophaga]TIA79136.1 hypothetical protein E3P98_03474 [Wallemia ichthyophaga]TIA88225.1 hypothetical protein E3P97_03625 [Wallemia ichthyophaga]TIA96023.1 hypothetical protein E3P95_03446 [Wallemia ichthyophaga]TIA97097.1 hypothetical protein E3P94_03433 [Wallemia ichthyophaga]
MGEYEYFGFDLSFLSSILGVFIIVGSSLIKLPQLYTLYRTGSSNGLSLSAFSLEAVAYFINYVYGYSHSYPFTTYGENLTLTFQNIAIIGLASKLPQIHANHRNASTGSLSPITTLAQLGGCCVRVLTSVHNAGDIPMTISFAGAALLNGILLAQIVLYARNRSVYLPSHTAQILHPSNTNEKSGKSRRD